MKAITTKKPQTKVKTVAKSKITPKNLSSSKTNTIALKKLNEETKKIKDSTKISSEALKEKLADMGLTKILVDDIKKSVAPILPNTPIETSTSSMFANIKKAKEESDAEKLHVLRTVAKRIKGLVMHKFNLNNIRSDKAGGLSSGKIHSPETRGYNLVFKSDVLAKNVAAFLEKEHYSVHLDYKIVTVDLIKLPEDIKAERHEKETNIDKMSELGKDLKQAIDMARTAHLSQETIAEKIWNYMQSNNIHVVDGNKKLTFEQIIKGENQQEWDLQSWTSLVVKEALKVI